MKRYYLCQVETSQDQWGDTVRRPAVAAYPVSYVMADGGTWALALVASKDHAQFALNAKIDALPDVPFDLAINSIAGTVKQGLASSLTKYGVDVAYNSSDSWGSVLRKIGQRADALFHEANFDVSE